MRTALFVCAGIYLGFAIGWNAAFFVVWKDTQAAIRTLRDKPHE